MSISNKQKKQLKNRRAHRVRARLHGSKDKPRLCVFRSLKHISAQLINDDTGSTVVAAHDHEIKAKKEMKPVALAAEVGKLLAEKATKTKINQVVFDRGSYRYHGRVKALAEAAREGGLEF